MRRFAWTLAVAVGAPRDRCHRARLLDVDRRRRRRGPGRNPRARRDLGDHDGHRGHDGRLGRARRGESRLAELGDRLHRRASPRRGKLRAGAGRRMLRNALVCDDVVRRHPRHTRLVRLPRRGAPRIFLDGRVQRGHRSRCLRHDTACHDHHLPDRRSDARRVFLRSRLRTDRCRAVAPPTPWAWRTSVSRCSERATAATGQGSASAASRSTSSTPRSSPPERRPRAWSLPLPLPPDGAYTIRVQARDAAGNESAPDVDLDAGFAVDTVGPATTLATTPATPDGSAGWFRLSSVVFTLAALDPPPGSGVASTAFRADGGAEQTYTGPSSCHAGRAPDRIPLDRQRWQRRAARDDADRARRIGAVTAFTLSAGLAERRERLVLLRRPPSRSAPPTGLRVSQRPGTASTRAGRPAYGGGLTLPEGEHTVVLLVGRRGGEHRGRAHRRSRQRRHDGADDGVRHAPPVRGRRERLVPPAERLVRAHGLGRDVRCRRRGCSRSTVARRRSTAARSRSRARATMS